MEKNRNNMENNKQNKNINNTYINDGIKGIVTVKMYSYCIKCGKIFPSPSSDPWCDFSCRSEYYQEIARDADDVYGELIGRD